MSEGPLNSSPFNKAKVKAEDIYLLIGFELLRYLRNVEKYRPNKDQIPFLLKNHKHLLILIFLLGVY